MDIDDQYMFDNDVSPHSDHHDLSFSFFHFSPNNNFFFHDLHDDHHLFVAHQHHQHQQQLLTLVDDDNTTTGTVLLADDQNMTHIETTVTNMAAAAAATATATEAAAFSLNGTKTDHDVHYALNVSSDDPSKNINNQNSTTTSTKRITPKKIRSGKKDRHSKIVTAQGPRDRRMRLSLEIARKFFSLQDMLGVDKASKTVEWLLTKSKPAIMELMKIGDAFSHESSTSPGSSLTTVCELISEFEETAAYNEDLRSGIFCKEKTSGPSPKEKSIKRSCKATFHLLGRESRVKARARARERTIEKKLWNQQRLLLDKSKQCFQANNPQNLNQFGFLSTPFKKGEESGPLIHAMKSYNLEVVTDHEVQKPSSKTPEHKGITKENNVDYNFLEPFKITRKSPITSNFNYHNHDIAGLSSNFQENRDIIIDNAGTSSSYYAMINMHLPTGITQERIPSSSIPVTSYLGC